MREMAAKLDVSQQTVSSYEVGKVEVSDDRAEQIATVLGINIVEVRRGLGLWVPDSEEWVEKLADQTLGYELDALRANLIELLDDLNEIIGRHVGDPDRAAERAEYRRALALGDLSARDHDQASDDLHEQLDELHRPPGPPPGLGEQTG